jgi:hypothetical protein
MLFRALHQSIEHPRGATSLRMLVPGKQARPARCVARNSEPGPTLGKKLRNGSNLLRRIADLMITSIATGKIDPLAVSVIILYV